MALHPPSPTGLVGSSLRSAGPPRAQLCATHEALALLWASASASVKWGSSVAAFPGAGRSPQPPRAHHALAARTAAPVTLRPRGDARTACASPHLPERVPGAPDEQTPEGTQALARGVLFAAARGTRLERRVAPLRSERNVSKQKVRAPTGRAPHVTAQLISRPLLRATAAECQFQRRRLPSSLACRPATARAPLSPRPR